MFTEKHFPQAMTGIELDQYLHNGWYRMGQTIFTCHFLFFENKLYSPIWIRLPLANYRFRKGLRKIKRQVETPFRVKVGPAVLDPFKEELFQHYRANFDGRLASTLLESLQDNGPFNIYDSQMVEVFDGKKLIAFSFFDVGEKSLASIQGVYHPGYQQYSLGFYTMIKEIEYGLDNGYEYFYPGYVVPGYKRFDYKLRIGKKEEIEYYNLKMRSWSAYPNFSVADSPIEVVSLFLTKLGWTLSKENISCQLLYYPAYDASVFGKQSERLLESPLFLNLFHDIFEKPKFIAYYDIWKERYIFSHSLSPDEFKLYFEYSNQYDSSSTRQFLDFLSQRTKIIETADPHQIAQIANRIGQLIAQPL